MPPRPRTNLATDIFVRWKLVVRSRSAPLMGPEDPAMPLHCAHTPLAAASLVKPSPPSTEGLLRGLLEPDVPGQGHGGRLSRNRLWEELGRLGSLGSLGS